MYPSIQLRSRQQGFLIPLALFILVGLLALALAASRLTGQSGVSATLEGLSTQAFYAAESGGQYAMHQLFFNVSDRTTADANCNALNSAAPLDFSGTTGLNSCSAELSCTLNTTPDASYYRITSEGGCGSGSLSAQRIIEISAYMP